MTVLALSVGKRRAYLVADTSRQPVAGGWGHVQKVFPNAVLGLVTFGRGAYDALVTFVTILGNLPLHGFDDAADAMTEAYDATVEELGARHGGLPDGAWPEIGLVGWSERQRCMRAVHCSVRGRGVELGPGLHLAPSDASFPAEARDEAELLEVARQQVAWCETHPDTNETARSGGKLVLTTLVPEHISQTVHEC